MPTGTNAQGEGDRAKPSTPFHPSRTPHLYTHRVDEELVILDQDGKVAHTLNATAGFLWDLCDGTRSPSDLATALAGRYRVEPDMARTDVDRALRDFRERRLLQGD